LKGKLNTKPKFYIYRIEFETGESYVGSHVEYKTGDNYICSSKYYQRHPELKIKERKILFYLPTLEQMNVMETICIISDKCNSSKNINGNYGNWMYNFHSKLDCPWNKGLKLSEEQRKKLSESFKEEFVCVETNEIVENEGHIADVSIGKRKTYKGKHYRKLTPYEKDLISKNNYSETKKLNKAFLSELYNEQPFYYSLDYNIAWESLEVLCNMLSINPQDFNNEVRGLKFEIVGINFLLENNIKIIKFEKTTNYKTLKIKCVETGEVFDSVKEATNKYKGHISDVINGKRKTAAGYHWIKI